jgi:diaminopimelate epimerase
MTTTRFYKMTGSGNDFVFLDGREHDLADWPAERIRAACDRRRGVGGDGLVHLVPEADALRMRYFNADGSHAAMCGNAALCATRLAVTLGLAGPERIQLETDAGRLESRCVGPGWSAELRFPTAEIPRPIRLDLVAGEQRAFQGIVGVPHTVVLVDDIDRIDVEGRGRELRRDPAFAPHGTNVNFVGRIDGEDAGWALRTYERGVEAETLACGTGTIAAALALAQEGLCPLPVRIRSGSGCVFAVAGQLTSAAEAIDVWLCGEGQLVFTGSLPPVDPTG